jgi:two-component system, NarL family, sensor kinase
MPHRSPDPSPPAPTERELRERLKELDCLYTVSRLFARHGASLDDILHGTVAALCAAWQYPEVACARIRLERREVTSAGRVAPVAAQTAPIIAHGEPVGLIEVGYTEERPAEDEGPFLNEERNLLNVVAQLLAEIIERKWAEAQLVAREEQLRRLTAELSLSEEREILQLLAEGYTARQIAARLCRSVKTVETHRRRIMEKVGVSTLAELTKFALREGLTSL